jgi:hypothetical protein
MQHAQIELLLTREMPHTGHKHPPQRPIIGPFGKDFVHSRIVNGGFPIGVVRYGQALPLHPRVEHPQDEVRHPPPSGWLDEPGRLKGGGVPSPYSNSLKPTIIVTGILVTDIRFDLFQLKANRGDRIATRPQVLARKIAIMAPKLAGDGNGTFALEKPNDRCHGMLGRDLDAHMHMIWHHMSLDDAAFLLAGQLMKDWPELTTNLPKQLLPATFGHKDNMVLAIPARMRQALIEC